MVTANLEIIAIRARTSTMQELSVAGRRSLRAGWLRALAAFGWWSPPLVLKVKDGG